MAQQNDAQLIAIAKSSLKDDLRQGTSLSSDMKSSLSRLTSARSVVGTLGSSSASLRRYATWYRLPSMCSVYDRINFFQYLILCYAGDRTTEIDDHKNLLVTTLGLLYADKLNEVVGAEVQVDTITYEQLGNISEYVRWMTNPSILNEDEHFEKARELKHNPRAFALPLPMGCLIGSVSVEPELISFYAYLGVICAAAVKDATGSGNQALTVSRFRAIRDKYKWATDNYPFLGGSSAPSVFSLDKLSDVWKRLPITKRVFFTSVCRIAEIGGSAEDEALFLTLRLMKFSDMTHVMIIGSFLVAYPWAASIPSLAPSVINFDNETRRLMKMCPDVKDSAGRTVLTAGRVAEKDASLLPYAKLIHGDTLDIVKRDSMLPLLYVAKRQLSITQHTLASYTVDSEFPQVYDDFLRVMELRGGIAVENDVVEEEEEEEE